LSSLEEIIALTEQIASQKIAKRIVVDSSYMSWIIEHSYEALVNPFFDGVPIVVDDTIGLSRGYILFSDGSIEKFGAWPKVQP
jgi:hypothetical protein